MSKERAIRTCYGCPYFHDEVTEPYFKNHPLKHCGQDENKCPYFLGTGNPLGTNKNYVSFYKKLELYNKGLYPEKKGDINEN